MTDFQVTRPRGAADGESMIGAARLRTVASSETMTVLQLTGEVDLSNAAELAEALQCAGRSVEHVELDVRYLKFCDVRGFRAILTAQHELWLQNVCLHLTGIPASLRLVLSVTRLDQHLLPCSGQGREGLPTGAVGRTTLGPPGQSP
jgi:anti-anti-sigma factor